jgi:hypothetical protein
VPPLSRWYIKAALIYFVVALLAGVLRAAEPLVALPRVIAAIGPAQVHLLVVGWITQMIFGVAYWMFPKYAPERPRGNDVVAVATFVLLNAGLLLRVAVEPRHTLDPTPTLGGLLVLSAAAQWLAGVGFVANTWSRIKVK